MRPYTLERRLPLLMTAALALALAMALTLAYRSVVVSAQLASISRLQTSVHELAQILSTTTLSRQQAFLRAAKDPKIQRAIATRTIEHPEVLEALFSLSPVVDSTSSTLILDPDRRPLVFFGSRQIDLSKLPSPPSFDSVGYGPIFTARNGYTHYWVMVAVPGRNGHPVGYLAQQLQIGSRGAAEHLRTLVGPNTKIYLQDPRTRAWTTVSGHPAPAPTGPTRIVRISNAPTRAISYDHGERVLSVSETLNNPPWRVVLELSQSSFLGTSHQLMLQFIILGMFTLSLAALATWYFIHRITRPLHALTDAATALAHGEYAARVPYYGKDEIGQLSSTFNQMAQEVATSHGALEESRERAQLANQEKSRFLATMSHEIRTPINAILGYADLLDLEIPGPLNATQKDNIQRIRHSTQHLLELINEILDMSKIESGARTLSCAPHSIAEDLDYISTLVAPQAKAKNIKLHYPKVDPSVLYLGEAKATRQILLNLLSNAIKFTPQEETIVVTELTGSHPTHQGRFLVVSVHDTGPGLSQEDQRRLFTPFTQFSSDTTLLPTQQGTGLGLYISHSLALLMHGDLTVQSTPGQGSTFTLWLPVPAETAPVQQSTA